jgi:tetratricopeptide (TPR) repeat protein
MDPNDARLEIFLGGCYWRMGRFNEAFAHLQRAFELQPDFAATSDDSVQLNQFAWALATDPDPARRNGPLAVALAEGVCQKTHYQATIFVGTLAAAYAEDGRFDDAILMQQKTIALLKQHGATNLLSYSQQLLALYLQHQPFHPADAGQGN